MCYDAPPKWKSSTMRQVFWSRLLQSLIVICQIVYCYHWAVCNVGLHGCILLYIIVSCCVLRYTVINCYLLGCECPPCAGAKPRQWQACFCPKCFKAEQRHVRLMLSDVWGADGDGGGEGGETPKLQKSVFDVAHRTMDGMDGMDNCTGESKSKVSQVSQVQSCHRFVSWELGLQEGNPQVLREGLWQFGLGKTKSSNFLVCINTFKLDNLEYI